jgi:hypothetical protein
MARGKMVPGEDEATEVAQDTSADISLLPTAEVQVEATDEVAAPEVGSVEYEIYVAELRRRRKPYGAQMQKLAYPQRAGYKRHWFNDVGGRVSEYEDAGWSKVTEKGSPVVRTVGSSRDNRPLQAFLMEIPTVFWQEVQDERHALAKSKMDQLKASPAAAPAGMAKASDREKFYSPREEAVQMTESVVRG